MHEDIYWQKYAGRYKSFPALLKGDHPKADIAVCIPVYAEPDLLLTLESLWHCDAPEGLVEVLVCFNKNGDMTPNEFSVHQNMWQACLTWVDAHKRDSFRFHPTYIENLPDPKGGVGWARKMVMDEAARRLDQDGVIICLDGDCTVESNYLNEIFKHFVSHPSCEAASIYYEHRFDALDGKVKASIIDYELHLRYLVHALRWTGHPFAYQTVGSSMAVRRRGYLAHGGMNTRKAGEDFYFLQKFIEVGTLQEIKTTVVYPSARISYRVPFGTGRAMNYLLSSQESWETTSFEVYRQLRTLLSKINRIGQICLGDKVDKEDLISKEFLTHPVLSAYLEQINFSEECIRIGKQTASPSSFRKRFFRYFNAFRVIRFSHDLRDAYFPDVPVSKAVHAYLEETEDNAHDMHSVEDYLHYFRSIDRGNVAAIDDPMRR